MFGSFLEHLRAAGIPVSVREYLTFLQALAADVPPHSADGLYHLARCALVKDEKFYDRFDTVFAAYFRGAELAFGELGGAIPDDWLRQEIEKLLSDEDKAKLQSLGTLQALLETLRQRLAEQQGRHQGGNKWIGTGGTSPFGHGGYHPEGVRIGGEGRQHRAAKVWEQRQFRDLDDQVELGTRNIKVALKGLRRLAREGLPEELDLDGTIRGTARRGYLDLHLRPQLRNRVKVLLFLDVGGSMDPHVRLCERLFSAARGEFKHLEYFYFHNCVYERLWRSNARRHAERFSTWDVLRRYGRDWKAIFVGDAAMAPYEITHVGGSVEHRNDEPGAVWLRRLLETWPSAAWLNPEREADWGYIPSIGLVRELMQDRMYPLTVGGLERAVQALRR
ncbi:VWA domain-containing protein [Immundisolibacter sp.]|uniref:vWA domain-containing protein n=1 Tax=Immundisolibacter sp. TaxID=1934948 RepID=UPI00262EBEA8|nr:VWA domain-containing protein [Immundisolibacter sp.]MDD3651486.1 VWA domain-containing protein [Immundisolibacter sp.]